MARERGGVGSSIATLFGAAAFIALMGASAGSACVPASTKLAAPIVCPKDHDRSIVVRRVSHPGAGKTSVSWDLWCAFPSKDRYPEPTNQLAVVGTLFGEYLLLTVALGVILALGSATQRRT